MQLRELAEMLGASPTPGADVTISGVTHNANWVRPGDIFVSITGARVDGHAFIDQAVGRGAVGVIGQGLPPGIHCPLPYLRVEDARRALAQVAAVVAGHPSRSLHVIGITGTDGKTTTSWLTTHLLRHSRRPTGLLSTVGYELPDGKLRQFPDHFTTPEAPEVQRILRQMREEQAACAVLETSSHALAMKRVEMVDFDTGIWTNLSSEHLDFHGTLERYFQDKATLFTRARFAVVNVDDPWGRELLRHCENAQTYSITGRDADWMATGIQQTPTHLHFHLDSPLGQAPVQVPMVGVFNVANALAAMAAAAHTGTSLEELVTGLRSFPGVPGRMQLVSTGEGTDSAHPRTIIDFAHTPAAVENLLATLRPSTPGKLWVVLGAPGRRDTTKRAPMGEVATRLADVAVFTEDDPRDDPITDIFEHMVAGARGRTNYHQIPDRTQAIAFALSQASAQDTVVLAGKGAERFIAREHGEDPWDETAVALAALKARGG